MSLKAQVFNQAQRCCLAKEGKKHPEQLRDQNDSNLAILIGVRLRLNFAETAQTPIRHDLHRLEPGRFRLGQGQGTTSERLKTVSSDGRAKLPAQPLIDTHARRFGSQGGWICYCL